MIPATADLCDACAQAEVCVLPWRVYGGRRAFAGSVRTLRCIDGLGGLRDRVSQPGHGQVLVIDAAGRLTHAVLGDLLAGLAVRQGWAGFVVHGVIRDSDAIASMAIGVMALGTMPRRADRFGASEVDGPVTFGGVTFTVGRRLVADADGVILLPAGLSEADIPVADAVAATAAYAAGSAPG